jgi:hypothetical protein
MTVLPFLLAVSLYGQTAADTLYAVDLYGLRSVSEAAVRQAVGVRAGDPVPVSLEPIRARVRAIAGVAEVDVSAVCCSENGRTLLYVGVREPGTQRLSFRAPPTGGFELPAEIVAAGRDFESALISAVQRGASAEDHSQGYALAEDSALRASQERFLEIAARHRDTLVYALHHSSSAAHRALASQILAYAEDRRLVARELVYAAGDSEDAVRNNAVRALAVLADWLTQNPQSGVSIPASPFIDFANSVSWTDRNKGVMLLMALTTSRDPVVLRELRARALDSLVEMARWSNTGHALPPCVILARLAGIEDEAAFRAFQAGEREAIISRAKRS